MIPELIDLKLKQEDLKRSKKGKNKLSNQHNSRIKIRSKIPNQNETYEKKAKSKKY